jgi:hypothetical protein
MDLKVAMTATMSTAMDAPIACSIPAVTVRSIKVKIAMMVTAIQMMAVALV